MNAVVDPDMHKFLTTKNNSSRRKKFRSRELLMDRESVQQRAVELRKIDSKPEGAKVFEESCRYERKRYFTTIVFPGTDKKTRKNKLSDQYSRCKQRYMMACKELGYEHMRRVSSVDRIGLCEWNRVRFLRENRVPSAFRASTFYSIASAGIQNSSGEMKRAIDPYECLTSNC